jgi:outer membrane lipoprotein-sorting protein
MKGNRHPITHSGLEYLVKNIKKDLRKGNHGGEIKIHEYGEEVVYGRKTRVAEVIFPDDESKGYYCYRIVMNLDVENKLPIRVQVFDWGNMLVEKYGYENLKLNPGLTDGDFDPNNPLYKF